MKFLREKLVPILFGLVAASIFIGYGVEVGPTKITPFDLLFAVFFGAYVLAGGKLKIRLNDGFLWTVIAFHVFAAVQSFLILPYNKTPILKEALQNGEFLLFYVVATNICSTPGRLNRFSFAFLTGCALIALTCTGYHFSRGDFAGYKLLDDPKHTYGIVFFILTAWFLYRPPKGFRRVFLMVMLCVFGAQFLLSGERKGWVAFAVAAAVMVVFYTPAGVRNALQWRLKLALRVAVGGLVVAFVFVILATWDIPYLTKQLDSFSDIWRNFEGGGIYYSQAETQSNQQRLLLMYQFESLFPQAWFMGYGEGTSTLAGMHSRSMSVLLDYGVAGYLFYLGVYVAGARRCWKIIKDPLSNVHVGILFQVCFFAYGFVVTQFLAGGANQNFFMLLPMAVLAGFENNRQAFANSPGKMAALRQNRRPAASLHPLRPLTPRP